MIITSLKWETRAAKGSPYFLGKERTPALPASVFLLGAPILTAYICLVIASTPSEFSGRSSHLTLPIVPIYFLQWNDNYSSGRIQSLSGMGLRYRVLLDFYC